LWRPTPIKAVYLLILAVPSSQPVVIEADDETIKAVEDWN
jgi:hypothetical protein